MTRVEITNNIAKALNVTQSKVDNYLITVLDCIKQGVIKDGKVIIRGFGVFSTRNKATQLHECPFLWESKTHGLFSRSSREDKVLPA